MPAECELLDWLSEIAARAICAERGRKSGDPDGDWRDFLDEAKAAIQAIEDEGYFVGPYPEWWDG